MSVAGQISESQIVAQDDNNIGLIRWTECGACGDKEGRQQDQLMW